ncbi:MAG: hypothetical protein U0Y82_08840 [Thermoleophilia bacterium]
MPALPGDAQPRPLPGQLTDDEARRMIGQLADGFPDATLILTGGDPLLRADLEDLVAHAYSLGLRVASLPAPPPRSRTSGSPACATRGCAR